MINTDAKYYLYRHIRLDKNEPFYIGIGTKRKTKGNSSKKIKSHYWIYDRAYSKNRKSSKIWNLIANKTEYIVEIVLESDDLELIKKKEQEFIKLYGRIDLKTGTLANMTDGGDGMNGHSRKFTEEQKLNLRNHSSCKPVVKLDSNFEVIETYKSAREAARKNNVDSGKISFTCRNKTPIKNNVTFRYLKDYNEKKSEIGKSDYRKIIIFDNKEWVMHDFCKYVESITNIHANTTYNRLNRGISPEKCIELTKKIKKKSNYNWKWISLNTGETIVFENMNDLSKHTKLSPHALRIRANRGYTRNGFKIEKIKYK